jgi:hypothetical protein
MFTGGYRYYDRYYGEHGKPLELKVIIVVLLTVIGCF